MYLISYTCLAYITSYSKHIKFTPKYVRQLPHKYLFCPINIHTFKPGTFNTKQQSYINDNINGDSDNDRNDKGNDIDEHNDKSGNTNDNNPGVKENRS